MFKQNVGRGDNLSVDTVLDENDAVYYPVEYINTLESSGLPHHRLILKKNAVVILLRNLDISSGLCNGTRLLILEVINKQLLKCVIITGETKGTIVLIPKIIMTPSNPEHFGFEWSRLQFPVRLAFAMTIHKSQGQTLDKVSIWLTESCFGHGQLYVAASRVGDPNSIRFFVPENEDGFYMTKNIVYADLLE